MIRKLGLETPPTKKKTQSETDYTENPYIVED